MQFDGLTKRKTATLNHFHTHSSHFNQYDIHRTEQKSNISEYFGSICSNVYQEEFQTHLCIQLNSWANLLSQEDLLLIICSSDSVT